MTFQSCDVSTISNLHKPKAKWSPDEDQILLGLIQEHGAHRWNELAESIPGRTGKQCRERWLSKLSPDFTAVPWTREEDDILIRCQETHGNQWAKFRSQLPNRSLVQIKNRWVSLTRRGFGLAGAAISPPLPQLEHAPAPTLPVCLGESAVNDFDFSAGVFDICAFDEGFSDQTLWSF
jgi:hypothetical protein